MAGGTALIAGGGAVLGLVGGSGVTAAASLLTDPKGAFALDECSKLLTFCQSDFARADMRRETVDRMRQDLLDQIERTEIQQDVLSMRSDDKDLDKAERKEARKELSGLKKSLGYMRNCEKELSKLINQKSLKGDCDSRKRRHRIGLINDGAGAGIMPRCAHMGSVDCRPGECGECP